MILVWLTAVTPDPSIRAAHHIPSSIAIGHGTTDEGDQITFAGESRLLWDLDAQLASGGEPIAVMVEPWQVQTRVPA